MANDKLTTISHAEVIEWAMQALDQSEINTTVVVETPWSNVLKISTQQGSVYLKQTPSDLFIEVDVIQKCRELCGIADIPEVIAATRNARRGTMSFAQSTDMSFGMTGEAGKFLKMQAGWLQTFVIEVNAAFA